MKKRILLLIIFIILLLGTGLVIVLLNHSQTEKNTAANIISLPSTGGDFARADAPREFVFPLDHGPHPEFQTEWWYYTGNLVSQEGKQFGYQLTFFRRAITPISEQVPRTSSWAASQVYLAHLTITDVDESIFRYYEKLDRGAAGLAGATGDPAFRVWLNDWQVTQIEPNVYQLTASEEDLYLALTLTDLKAPILHGSAGLSQKGPQPGNASYYISQTRLMTSGELGVGEKVYSVTGSSWMDHEFSTSALSGDQVGWDWFSLQLDNNIEIMVYTLRRSDGSLDPYSAGTIIYADGSTRSLTNSEFSIQSTGKWKSPHSAGVYPSGWTLDIPDEGISLEITPIIQDQELRVSFTYWEGAVRIEGNSQSTRISGVGYVELTGYTASMQGTF